MALKPPRTFDQIQIGEFFRSPEDVKCRKAGRTTAIMWEAGDSAYRPGETVPFHPAEVAEYSPRRKLLNVAPSNNWSVPAWPQR